MSDKYNNEEESLLQKIQNKSGCLLLVIGAAMLAFVLTDFVSSGTSIFGSSENNVGSIAGQPITYEEFNGKFEELKNQVLQNNPGFVMDEATSAQYRDEAWKQLIEAKTIKPEHEKLGLSISAAELEDLTIGDNTHAQIRQSFTDPNTGVFDKNRLVRFLKEDINANPEALKNWKTFQDQFTASLVNQKYSALISSSFYSTDLDARIKGQDERKSINASIVALPYQQVADSLYEVSDKQLISYAKRFGEKYEQKASRDIEFVTLYVIPSREDSIRMLDWTAEAIEKFASTTEDSLFVSIMNSETPFDPTFKVRGSFSPEMEDNIFGAETGKVVGPFQKDGVYTLFKVLATGNDSLRSVKASHILFSVFGSDTAKAEEDARAVLAKIKSGETTFATEASLKNYDATRNTGGDMGWVREESGVYPKRLMKTLYNSGEGNYVIVRSERGVHLAKATSAVSRKTVQVAVLDQSLFASSNTDGDVYKLAGELLTKAQGDKSFEEVAESMNITKRVANRITEENRSIAGISEPNKVARWLFDENTKEGDISSIIDLNGSYLVARVSKMRSAGLPDAQDLRGELETLVRNELKAKDLKPKMEGALAKATSADELAKALGVDVISAPATSFMTGSLAFIGQDEKIIGTVLGTPVGKRSEVVEGKGAVAVVFVNNENQYDPADVASLKMLLKMENSQGIEGDIQMALNKKADVTDTRYKFYD